MDKTVTLEMDGDSIRFTEDGKMAVIDAIAFLTSDERPACILEKLKQKNPNLETSLETFTIGGEPVAVADSRNWEIIEILLLEYLMIGAG
jgi:hypothetical protein